MGRNLKRNRGQFVVIAALLMAIMIVSTGTLMYRAATFYRHEPWEEYLTLVGDVELNSRHLIELSLANYTQDQTNEAILNDNLWAWRRDLVNIYPSEELSLEFALPDGLQTFYGLTPNPNFRLGLNLTWNQTISYSAAQANFTLSIKSVGLAGYRFSIAAVLKLRILNYTGKDVYVTVTAEDNMPVIELKKEDFQIKDATLVSVDQYYDATHTLVYLLNSSQPLPSPLYVTVQDHRGIMVTAKYS